MRNLKITSELRATIRDEYEAPYTFPVTAVACDLASHTDYVLHNDGQIVAIDIKTAQVVVLVSS